MTVHELLTAVQAAGIRLEAHGDRLHVDTPRGAVTPELRDELGRRKAEILAVLQPVEFVTLKGGLIVPLPALRLALDLEARGYELWLDRHEQIVIAPAVELTDADRAAIQRWRLHLGAIVGYQAPAM